MLGLVVVFFSFFFVFIESQIGRPVVRDILLFEAVLLQSNSINML